MIDKLIDNYREDIISHTQKLIQIPSIYSNDSTTYPFGYTIHDALSYVLNLGDKLGFRTTNLNNYCGYLEFGDGDEIFGIVGHLDVVPIIEQTWKYPPFSGEIHSDKIYGRGAIDNKGPIIASIYAMKLIMDNFQISRRVRLILGLDEERNWESIQYYKSFEELPSLGFSPDADFPAIFAEKALFNILIESDYDNSYDLVRIIEINDFNNPSNIVPKMVSAILEIDETISSTDFTKILRELISIYTFDIEIYQINYKTFKLTSYGKEAHSAHCDLGINAISNLLILLHDLFDSYSISIPFFRYFKNYIGNEYNGKNLNIDFSDLTGNLSLNVSSLKFSHDQKCFSSLLDLRVPCSISPSTIKIAFSRSLSFYNSINYTVKRFLPSLFVDNNSYLVSTLCDIFNKNTNSSHAPIAIGGATYARAFENIISFGPNFPGELDLCHKSDECISISNLLLITKIYTDAILELNKKT